MTDISIQIRPEQRFFVTEHNGPPHRIGEAFDRLIAWASPRGLLGQGHLGATVYLTDMTAPGSEQRALAGLSTDHNEASDDPGIVPYLLPGGRYAVALHKGPYTQIGQTWRALYAWLADNNEQAADRPPFEVNLNNPRLTAPENLLTEVCVPLKPD